MALYAIGDLHLSLDGKKPMDIFDGWQDYIQQISSKWNELVTDEDTVVLCGDTSWAMKLEEAFLDFDFINALPGKKIILKGNHDYWWTTKNKMDTFCIQNNFETIQFLHNNAYTYNGFAICGTRSWFFDLEDSGDEKVFLRELGRLEASLKAAQGMETITFLHYPPIYKEQIASEIITLLSKYHVKECFYGHLHGKSCQYAFQDTYNNISFKMISADYLQFKPYLIKA